VTPNVDGVWAVDDLVTPRETRDQFLARVRGFETRLQQNMDKIMCPTHLSLGQEEVAADLWEVIQPQDWVFSTHRNHHHYLAKGGNEQALWDEIMGLPSGLNGGFSGSQGISDASINFHASAIVGGLVGVAAGTAYALSKTQQSTAIVVCCIGDAGTEAGVFWETLNFCVLNNLPIAFIVENNGKSVDSPIHERQARGISERAEAFGVTICDSVQGAIGTARYNGPSFHEAHVELICDHLNMSSMMPSLGLR
jgi:TPP-dependent pyruvate/acetoin dehydrogenase alpha subunit